MNHTFIIGEVGPNHNGDAGIAHEMVTQLARIGVDAVKFQLADPTKLYSKDAIKAAYQKENDLAVDVLEAARKRQLSHEAHKELKDHCLREGVEYLCTGFDLESVRFLHETLHVERFKIPSGEILTPEILHYISDKTSPIILSTGMATNDEIKYALAKLDNSHSRDITILHCVSQYPVANSAVNLRVMDTLRNLFGYPVGYSDHTEGNEAAIAAVAMGAKVVEKHVTLDKSWPGPDHRASATIDQFRSLVQSIREIEKLLGSAERKVSVAERSIAMVARKSAVARRDLSIGEIITEQDICFKRPGTGFLPSQMSQVSGRKVKTPIAADTVIRSDALE